MIIIASRNGDVGISEAMNVLKKWRVRNGRG